MSLRPRVAVVVPIAAGSVALLCWLVLPASGPGHGVAGAPATTIELPPPAADRQAASPAGAEVELEAPGPRRIEHLGGPEGLAVVAGQVVVRFRDGTPAEEIARFHQRHHTRVLQATPDRRYLRLALPDGQTVQGALAAMRTDAVLASRSAVVAPS